jgi:hypothetical protein
VGGERAGNRTPNLVVKSHLLCQLSYAPGRKLEAPGFEIKARSDLNSRGSVGRTKAAATRRFDPEFITDVEADLDSPR